MIEDLRRIIFVIQEGSVTKAAQKLYMTQPALSQAIKRVEKHLGIKLFRENGKKLALTQNGKESAIVMERILKLWESMKQKANHLQKTTCTIGIYDNAALLLSPFCKKYYGSASIGLEVIIDNSEKLFTQLTYGILDLCICILNPEKTLPANVELITYYEEELIPVSSQKWERDLGQLPFILYNRDSITRKYIDKEFIKHAIQPRVIAESISPHFIKELALIGSGVALLPKNIVKSELQNKTLYQLHLPLHFKRTVAIYRNKTNTSEEMQSLINEIKSLLI